jgi:hypothetical protein
MTTITLNADTYQAQRTALIGYIYKEFETITEPAEFHKLLEEVRNVGLSELCEDLAKQWSKEIDSRIEYMLANQQLINNGL